MKKLSFTIIAGAAILLSSCSKKFDINDNPNDATSATPILVMPQALVGTASNMNGFNSYGAQLVGYSANAGGYGGFGVSISYNFTSGNFTGLWSSTYNNLEDYQAIINYTESDPQMSLYNAMAHIMRAHGFQLLVDAYNDIPYSQALKGADVLNPAYDDAATVYKSLADELDQAVTSIDDALANVTGLRIPGNEDVLFKGNMVKWKQFANTLRLRLMLHANGKVNFSNTSFSSDGFLTTDALVNPGYVRDNGRQNPKWNTWGFTPTATGAKSWMPNTFVMAFYNGTKLNDPGRGSAIYLNFPGTPTNRLGYESTSVSSSPEGSFWYPGSDRNPKTAGNSTGVLKGPEAGMPIITAAESYFLQAEAVVKGIISGSAETLFKNGITASFNYLYMLPSGAISGNPAADASDYMLDNSSSYLVNFSLATTPEMQEEAIITQKYIALNYVNSDEAWNEYRRTHYPYIVNTPGATATETFASTVSESTRPDHLPTRILYPSSEGAYNSTNVPKGISPFTSLIFWAL